MKTATILTLLLILTVFLLGCVQPEPIESSESQQLESSNEQLPESNNPSEQEQQELLDITGPESDESIPTFDYCDDELLLPPESYAEGSIIIMFSPLATEYEINNFLESIGSEQRVVMNKANSADLAPPEGRWQTREEAETKDAELRNMWQDVEEIIIDHASGESPGWQLSVHFNEAIDIKDIEERAAQQGLKTYFTIDTTDPNFIEGMLLLNVPIGQEKTKLCEIQKLQNPIVTYVSPNLLVSIN